MSSNSEPFKFPSSASSMCCTSCIHQFACVSEVLSHLCMYPCAGFRKPQGRAALCRGAARGAEDRGPAAAPLLRALHAGAPLDLVHSALQQATYSASDTSHIDARVALASPSRSATVAVLQRRRARELTSFDNNKKGAPGQSTCCVSRPGVRPHGAAAVVVRGAVRQGARPGGAVRARAVGRQRAAAPVSAPTPAFRSEDVLLMTGACRWSLPAGGGMPRQCLRYAAHAPA